MALHVYNLEADPTASDMSGKADLWSTTTHVDFTLLRFRGCTGGSITFPKEFLLRATVPTLGQWLAVYRDSERLYVGKVTERAAALEGGVTCTLEGPITDLNTVRPGHDAPRSYGASTIVDSDPTASITTRKYQAAIRDTILDMMDEYGEPGSVVVCNDNDIVAGLGNVSAFKVDGTQGLTDLLGDLVTRSGSVHPWGVNEWAELFVSDPNTAEFASYQAGVRDAAIARADWGESLEHVYNRVELTGGPYWQTPAPGVSIRRQWLTPHEELASIAEYGRRTYRPGVPGIRTTTDANNWAAWFLSVYAQPQPRYTVTVVDPTLFYRPYRDGRITLVDVDGTTLGTFDVESATYTSSGHELVQVLQVGPLDPRSYWPEADPVPLGGPFSFANWSAASSGSWSSQSSCSHSASWSSFSSQFSSHWSSRVDSWSVRTRSRTTWSRGYAYSSFFSRWFWGYSSEWGTASTPNSSSQSLSWSSESLPSCSLSYIPSSSTCVELLSSWPYTWACPDCASPPGTVTVVLSGATDPDCDGTYVCNWLGLETCWWTWTSGADEVGVHWDGVQWVVSFTIADCTCGDSPVSIAAGDCNTGGNVGGCGGTVTVTP